MALKFITAEEAASFVHHDDNVGFSGFTPAGSAYKSQLPVGIDLKTYIFKNGVGAGWVGKGKMFRFYH